MKKSTTQQIKKNMEQAKKDIVSGYVVTKICIKRLEKNIKTSKKLINQFKLI